MPPSRAPSPPRGGMDDAISRNDAFMEKVLDRMTKLMLNGRSRAPDVEEEDVFESSDDDTIKSYDEEGATTTAVVVHPTKTKGGRVGKKQGKKTIPYLP